MTYRVVWFKRDLRVHDHAALAAAAAQGPLLCLYIIESGLWQQPDVSSQHYDFMLECLQDLRQSLRRLGATLLVQVGPALSVLQRLYQVAPFESLFSHEETGNDFTFKRDKSVAVWCRARGVPWHEYPQTGVIRRLHQRDGWAAQWEAFVAEPCRVAPVFRSAVSPVPDQEPPSAAQLSLYDFNPPNRQTGGRRQAIRVLQSFLAERSARYRGGISSPLSAPTACSRISPYLALGCVSLKEVVQATRRQIDRLPSDQVAHRRGLQAFIKRLHWHCHFIQKLESEPEIEWQNMHRGYDGLREGEHDARRFDTLVQGRTGWPLVDACVAMLNDCGWLNFRMRAMLVSVAAYPLWLHWRPVGLWLARAFLDYEPGIHWSQVQMQSGTTGINATRVYNPIKQAKDHDPNGYFVRRWLPYMRHVPQSWLYEPWRMPPGLLESSGLVGDGVLPLPLVDLEQATRQAKQRLHARRADPVVRAASRDVLQRHGSRQTPLRSGKKLDKKAFRKRRPLGEGAVVVQLTLLDM